MEKIKVACSPALTFDEFRWLAIQWDDAKEERALARSIPENFSTFSFFSPRRRLLLLFSSSSPSGCRLPRGRIAQAVVVVVVALATVQLFHQLSVVSEQLVTRAPLRANHSPAGAQIIYITRRPHLSGLSTRRLGSSHSPESYRRRRRRRGGGGGNVWCCLRLWIELKLRLI